MWCFGCPCSEPAAHRHCYYLEEVEGISHRFLSCGFDNKVGSLSELTVSGLARKPRLNFIGCKTQPGFRFHCSNQFDDLPLLPFDRVRLFFISALVACGEGILSSQPAFPTPHHSEQRRIYAPLRRLTPNGIASGVRGNERSVSMRSNTRGDAQFPLFAHAQPPPAMAPLPPTALPTTVRWGRGDRAADQERLTLKGETNERLHSTRPDTL